MDLLALLKKEWLVVRRNLGLFILLLIIFPGLLIVGTGAYDRTIPEDIPVAIVPADDTTTEDDLNIIRGGVTFFASPIDYENGESAREDLNREQVYLILEVPGGLTDEEADVNFTIVSDQTFAPFQDPANISADILDNYLGGALPADITVNHDRIGEHRGLTSFLVPTVLLAFIVLYGLIFVPYQFYKERQVLNRLRTETRIETVVVSKIGFHTGLLLTPLIVTAFITDWLSYGVSVINPLTIVTTSVSFLFLVSFGLATLFLLNLRREALFINAVLALGILTTSSFIYPVGFFSPLRQMIARAIPTHYSIITLRSATLRDVPATLYQDYLAYLLLTWFATSIILIAGIVLYRRVR